MVALIHVDDSLIIYIYIFKLYNVYISLWIIF